MIQVLQRNNPTFGEQFASGLQAGGEKGSGFGQEILSAQIKNQMQKRAISDKLSTLKSQEYSELFKDLDPRLAGIAQMAASGLIDPGVATSMAEMIRQSQSDIDFSKAIQGSGENEKDNFSPPIGTQGQEISKEKPSPQKPTGQRDYGSEIKKWQDTLRFAKKPEQKAFVESQIKELQDLRNKDIKKTEASQERSYKRNEKYFTHLDEVRRNSRKKDLALQQIGSALKSGNFDSYRNKIGSLTGLDFVKNATAQTVNTAAKEYLVSSLADITGRPNMFLEQSISKAMVNPLYKEEANDLIFEGFQLLRNLEKKEDEIASQLEASYTENGGEIPRNFQKIVADEVDNISQPMIQTYQDRIDRLLNIEDKQGLSGKRVDVIGPDGEEWDIDESQVGDLPEGYRVK